MVVKRRKKSQQLQTTTEYLAALEAAIRQLAHRHHLFTVFRHFVELSALTLSNAADPINKKAERRSISPLCSSTRLKQCSSSRRSWGCSLHAWRWRPPTCSACFTIG